MYCVLVARECARLDALEQIFVMAAKGLYLTFNHFRRGTRVASTSGSVEQAMPNSPPSHTNLDTSSTSETEKEKENLA